MWLLDFVFSIYGLLTFVVIVILIDFLPHIYTFCSMIYNLMRLAKYKKVHPTLNTIGYAGILSESRSDLAVYSVNGERPAYDGRRLALPVGAVEIIADYCERPENHPRASELLSKRNGRHSNAPLGWNYVDMQRKIAINKLERPENAKKPYFIIKFEVKPEFEYTFEYKYYEGILSVNARDPKTFRFTTVAEDTKLDPEEPEAKEPEEKVFH